MGTSSNSVEILVENEAMNGTFLAPRNKVPGVLFVHGWGAARSATSTGHGASPAWAAYA